LIFDLYLDLRKAVYSVNHSILLIRAALRRARKCV